jgi:hypothetical protein
MCGVFVDRRAAPSVQSTAGEEASYGRGADSLPSFGLDRHHLLPVAGSADRRDLAARRCAISDRRYARTQDEFY